MLSNAVFQEKGVYRRVQDFWLKLLVLSKYVART